MGCAVQHIAGGSLGFHQTILSFTQAGQNDLAVCIGGQFVFGAHVNLFDVKYKTDIFRH